MIRVGFSGHANVDPEQVLLNLPVRMVVIVVEPGLADADHARVRSGFQKRGLAQIGMTIGLVRMDADTGPDIAFTLGRGDDVGPFALAGRDVEKSAHARLSRAPENLGLIFDQALVVEMAV